MCEVNQQVNAPYSVLLSVYKNEKSAFLQQALDSMFGQTVPPNEVVLVEDGPLTDALYATLDSFTATYGNRFKRVVNERNLGLGLALQRGLKQCSNELVARMDTDDVSKPDRCEKQLAYFMRYPDTDVVGTWIEEFDTDIERIESVREVPAEHEEICSFLKKRCPFNHVSVMFKKSAVENAGGYMDWHYNEDYYLWIRMYMCGCRFANLPESLVSVRTGKDMFARRGGKAYYESEKNIFRYMCDNKIITRSAYRKAKYVRFIVQRMMPNKVRAWAYRKFVRK